MRILFWRERERCFTKGFFTIATRQGIRKNGSPKDPRDARLLNFPHHTFGRETLSFYNGKYMKSLLSVSPKAHGYKWSEIFGAPI